MARQSRKSQSGFTLVELLIVVAIIGVLSVVATPTFRRMIAKSKKSEAKVGLGGIYTAEQAFLSEYNAYGNNLAKVGVEVDGSQKTNIYTMGFPTANCGVQAVVQPPAASGVGTSLGQVFPSYYTAAMLTTVGRVSAGNALPNAICASAAGTAGLAKAANVFASGGSNVADNFLASATGAISAGIQPSNGQIINYDVWSIDQGRNLINTQDGVL